MKNIVCIGVFIFTGLVGLSGNQVYAASDKNELKTTEATLTIDQKGNLKIIQNRGRIIQISTPMNNLWKIVLKNSLTGKVYEFSPDKSIEIKKTDGVIRLVKSKFLVENDILPVKMELTISVKNDAFCFSGSLKSDLKEWIFKELEYPNIFGIQVNGEKLNIYWPNGLGQRFTPKEFGSRNLWYPALSASMPWFSLNSDNGGLYIGSHDPLQARKDFDLTYVEEGHLFNASVKNLIYKSEHTIPDIMVKPYTGEWYNAANYYRSWYNENFTVATSPDWVINDTGWLLTILKQQNRNLMWSYEDIEKLCDIAEQFNLTTIGLFGWAIGGHDRLYPNYVPDPMMGGTEGLKSAIERAHKRGIRIIMYANGKIMDTATDYYVHHGIETMFINEDYRPDMQFYIKHFNSTPIIFAGACTGSPVWRKTMYDLALQAQSLGADGILFDQLGVLQDRLCFSKYHDHEPGQGDSKYRLRMINEIRQKVKESDPDFILMTEATNAVTIREIDYTHGCGIGTSTENEYAFPELYRFTFPELITTQRNPNPMITRTDANFAASYGLRHEVECRYSADVNYLLNGTIPTAESYSNVHFPPNVIKIRQVSAEDAKRYVYNLVQFEKRHADFLRYGKFIDQYGINVEGEDISAKGYLSKDKIGVIVWNKSLKIDKSFSISIPGYKLTNASEPLRSKVSAFSSLEANSLRFLIFHKE